MAAAISETSEALEDRQTAEAAIRAENDRLAHDFVRLKKLGLVTDLIPLDQIKATKLTRDRMAEDAAEMDELKASIRTLGLSNPIRVEEVDGGYELIQGQRRLTAYRQLWEETGAARFEKIPAGINARGEETLQLYRRMVDENLIRKDISFGEMAMLALSYKREEQHIESYDQAVELLFSSAARQKRAYIKSFARLLGRIEQDVRFVEGISRSLGLDLVKILDEDPQKLPHLRNKLEQFPDRDAAEELAILQAFAKGKRGKVAKPAPKKVAKTTLRLTRPGGVAKCTAAQGKVELQMDRDFSAIDRATLEEAIEAFFAALD
jgi:ParB family chromosome partitioning protein